MDEWLPSETLRNASKKVHALSPDMLAMAVKDLLLALAHDLSSGHPFPSGGWLAGLRWANRINDGSPTSTSTAPMLALAAREAGWTRTGQSGLVGCFSSDCTYQAFYRHADGRLGCKKHVHELVAKGFHAEYVPSSLAPLNFRYPMCSCGWTGDVRTDANGASQEWLIHLENL